MGLFSINSSNWQQAGKLDEIHRTACELFRLSYGLEWFFNWDSESLQFINELSFVPFSAGERIQRYQFWSGLQELVEWSLIYVLPYQSSYAGSDQITPYADLGEDDGYEDNEYFWQAVGGNLFTSLTDYGWRRKLGDGSFVRGQAQLGDVIGKHLIEDLVSVLSFCKAIKPVFLTHDFSALEDGASSAIKTRDTESEAVSAAKSSWATPDGDSDTIEATTRLTVSNEGEEDESWTAMVSTNSATLRANLYMPDNGGIVEWYGFPTADEPDVFSSFGQTDADGAALVEGEYNVLARQDSGFSEGWNYVAYPCFLADNLPFTEMGGYDHHLYIDGRSTDGPWWRENEHTLRLVVYPDFTYS